MELYPAHCVCLIISVVVYDDDDDDDQVALASLVERQQPRQLYKERSAHSSGRNSSHYSSSRV